MRILQIAAECAPIAKAGGLADVVFGLTRALIKAGHEVTVILPHYGELFDAFPQQELATFVVTLDGQPLRCKASLTQLGEIPLVLIGEEVEGGLLREPRVYGSSHDSFRFVLFCQAVLEMLRALHWVVDLVHVHDWPTALLPVLLQQEPWVHSGLVTGGSCLTLHNLESQGIIPPSLLSRLGIASEELTSTDRLGDPHRLGELNLLRGGIAYADALTTVSPTYAHEILDAPGGRGLEDVLRKHMSKLTGILNGLDFDYWNPKSDPHLPVHYTAALPAAIPGERHALKRALQGRLALQLTDRPLFMTVSRLVPQKGIDLIQYAVQRVLQLGGQYIVLGSSPIPTVQEEFHAQKLRLHSCRHVHFHLAPDEELTHWMFAGSDFTLIPSLFEPCGLTQMIGLRYGSIPIVRETGGLADTIFDVEYGHVPEERRNGFSFQHADRSAIDWVLNRAFSWYDGRPKELRDVQLRGMQEDHSWHIPAEDYLRVYKMVLSQS